MTVNMLCVEPTVFYILKIHPCIYVIPESILCLPTSFVNAQHNVDLYIKLHILKGQFSQQMTIAEGNNIVEPGVFSDRGEHRLQSLVAETNDADLSCFFIWFQCLDAPAMRGF